MTAQEPSGEIVVQGRSLSSGGAWRKKTLTIVVDGQARQGRFVSAANRQLHFGRGDVLANRIPVTAGTHSVKIFYDLWRKEEAGVCQVQVDVADSTECRLDYLTPNFFLGGKGKIKVNPTTWLTPTVFVELGPVGG